MSWYRYESDALILKFYVQPGAKRNEIVGIMQDELKIKLASQAIESRANIALIKFLAQLFKVPRSSIVLRSGGKSRHKIIEINKSGLNHEQLCHLISET